MAEIKVEMLPHRVAVEACSGGRRNVVGGRGGRGGRGPHCILTVSSLYPSKERCLRRKRRRGWRRKDEEEEKRG